MPPPSGPRSSTTTDFPAFASSYAVDSPAIPAPTTTTSARPFRVSAGASVTDVVLIHKDLLRSELAFMTDSSPPESRLAGAEIDLAHLAETQLLSLALRLYLAGPVAPLALDRGRARVCAHRNASLASACGTDGHSWIRHSFLPRCCLWLTGHGIPGFN